MKMKILRKFSVVVLILLSTLSISFADNTDLLYGIYYSSSIKQDADYREIIDKKDHEIQDNEVLSEICFYLFKFSAHDIRYIDNAAYFLAKSYEYNNQNIDVINVINTLYLDKYNIKISFNDKYISLKQILT